MPERGPVEQWWHDGERVQLYLRGARRHVFVAHADEGPHMTLLHGYPSSSHDWAKVWGALDARHELLAPDFLGFGGSDKPADHDYSLLEQADLVEALWAHDGVSETVLVAHDYGTSVAQELLARRADGTLAVDLHHVHLMNGGVYPDLHRPEPIQTALLDPEQGPTIGPLITQELFTTALAPTFAPGYDAAADSADIWAAVHREDGPLISHRLIRYLTDRAEHGERWVAAMEGTDVPLSFIWGMLDPVSGAHMAARIRERIPQAPFLALDDVGHWPPLEAPDRVAAALLG